jgi:glycosyltransferase involved in cell wall biosynthesis
MVPTYRSARYLREALESVVSQAPEPADMQIEVVDDCSDDEPDKIVTAFAGRVGFFRQPRNVGHVANFNISVERARGELVHLLHGDDAVRDGFYAALGRPFDERPDVGAAFCRFIAVDGCGRWVKVSDLEAEHDGLLEGWLERIAIGQRLQPPCMVVRRSVYERLGGFDSRIRRYGEDWEMWTRIAAHYPVWHVVEPLALYRIQPQSLSGASLTTGENVGDLRRVIAINREVLPPDRAEELTRRALEVTATTALRRSRRLLAGGNAGGARAQAREALRSSRSAPVLARWLVFQAARLRRAVRRRAGTA